MPLSRDPRMDRRKRILRESLPSEEEGALGATVRPRTRRSATSEDGVSEEPLRRRSAGYSQDVRGACQHRLVQLIPVRRRAYLLTVFASCLIPATLLLLHYLIYVNPLLNWYGHPLAKLLDASHPRSIAAWMSGQMWLLCLASTVLTFRLRRHKLDDYNGDYQLWFWLVSTCVIGSFNSTTHVIDLFGEALNRWSQLNIGWTGPAVVQATLATLVGMLGLRLCSELKKVPTSLVFWLVGLVAWAGSAALSQDMLKIDISIQFRFWLRSALWLGGLTSIWLASLSYLRVVYIEAQRRFLLRGRLAASLSSTWKERLTESMPAMPKMPSFRLLRPADDDPEEAAVGKKRREKVDAPEKQTEKQLEKQTEKQTEKQPRRFGLPSFMKRKPVTGEEAAAKDRSQELRSERRDQKTEQRTDSRTEQNAEPRTGVQAGGPLSQSRRAEPSSQASSSNATSAIGPKASIPIKQAMPAVKKDQTAQPVAKRTWLSRLVSKPGSDDEAPEYRKVDKATRVAEQLAAKNEKLRLKEEQRQAKTAAAASARAASQGDSSKKRSWMPKLSIPKLKMPTLPRPKMPKIGMPKISMPKMGMPKLKLPSLRLPPPDAPSTSENRAPGKSEIRPLPTSKPMPTTNGPTQESMESGGRPLSKAERKRLKRLQDDQDYDVEDRRAA